VVPTKLTGRVAEPVIPIEPPARFQLPDCLESTLPETLRVIFEPLMMTLGSTVTEPLKVPLTTLTFNVSEPVIPTDPETAVPTKLIGKVAEPVIPTDPETAVPTRLTGRVAEEPVMDKPIEPVIDFPISPIVFEPVTESPMEPVIPMVPNSMSPLTIETLSESFTASSRLGINLM
jgi:hypothetical protein